MSFDGLLARKKGSQVLRKIVIVSKDKAKDQLLTEFLGVLFPECEILSITSEKIDAETLSNGSLTGFHDTEERGVRSPKTNNK